MTKKCKLSIQKLHPSQRSKNDQSSIKRGKSLTKILQVIVKKMVVMDQRMHVNDPKITSYRSKKKKKKIASHVNDTKITSHR